jgi:geranyl-CoA carboxylase alpha subunit
VTLEGEPFAMRVVSREDNQVRFSRRGIARLASFARDGDELWLDFDGACRCFIDRTYAPPQLKDELSDGAVRSPVSGVIVGVEAKAGDRVRRGQALATIEAMKMQYSILAPIAGVVTMANAALGAQAQARALLFAIEPPGD